MKWPLMTADEIHAFGIDVILPYVQKEGVTVESTSRDPLINPQIVGRRWNSPAIIFVRSALYPSKGMLTEAEFTQFLKWADDHGATAFFASVGLACTNYPDKTPVQSDSDMRLPIRHGGFAVAYEGLVVMTTSDRVRMWNHSENSPPESRGT